MAYCWLVKRANRGGTYYLRYAKSLGRKWESLGTTDKKLAKHIQATRESELWNNAHGVQPATPEKITYSEAVNLYLDHKRSMVREEKTITDYKRIFQRFGTYLKADVQLSQITEDTVEHYISFFKKSKTKDRSRSKREVVPSYAPKTLRNEFFALVGLFQWARRKKYIAADPMEEVKKPARVRRDDPRVLTRDEFLALKAACEDPEMSEMIDFYLLTGIRRSDGHKVTSENFDFERNVAKLPQSKQGNTKTIPLSDDLRELVQQRIKRIGTGKPLVTMHKDDLSTAFAAAREKAGLPATVTFHSLRHTFVSWLIADGNDVKTVQQLVGHSDIQSTMIYTHAFDRNMRTAMERFALPRSESTLRLVSGKAKPKKGS